jgi:hypothetical protein
MVDVIKLYSQCLSTLLPLDPLGLKEKVAEGRMREIVTLASPFTLTQAQRERGHNLSGLVHLRKAAE